MEHAERRGQDRSAIQTPSRRQPIREAHLRTLTQTVGLRSAETDTLAVSIRTTPAPRPAGNEAPGGPLLPLPCFALAGAASPASFFDKLRDQIHVGSGLEALVERARIASGGSAGAAGLASIDGLEALPTPRRAPASGGRGPMSGPRRVLAAALPAELTADLAPALERSDFDLNRVPSYGSAGELARLIPFDALLLGFDDDASALALLDAVREPDSESRYSRVLVFAAPEALDRANRALSTRVDRVLSTARGAVELQETVLELLRERVRLATRVLARLTVKIAEGDSRFVCQTRDLSQSGMLVITDNRYPVGAGVKVVLDLPGGSGEIAGDAEVVRHAAPPRDPVTGLGLRFVRLRPGDEQRLVDFLARHGT